MVAPYSRKGTQMKLSRRNVILSGGLAAGGIAAATVARKRYNRFDHYGETFTEGDSGLSNLPKSAKYTLDEMSVNSIPDGKFKLKFAPHYGQFEAHAGSDYLDQIKFCADQGFRAWEDNIAHWRSEALQLDIARTLQDNGMEFGVFIAADLETRPNLSFTPDDDGAEQFLLSSLRSALPAAKNLGSKWVTVIMGFRHPSVPFEYQMSTAIDALRRAADILEPAGITMVMEPINTFQRPHILLQKMRDVYLLCRAVSRPSCKLLFDVYHQQIMQGAITYDLESCWDEMRYIQISDYPGRNEPTTGEINFANIFEFLQKRGYDGIIGMEHGMNGKGLDGERAVIDAYRYCDSFLEPKTTS